MPPLPSQTVGRPYRRTVGRVIPTWGGADGVAIEGLNLLHDNYPSPLALVKALPYSLSAPGVLAVEAAGQLP